MMYEYTVTAKSKGLYTVSVTPLDGGGVRLEAGVKGTCTTTVVLPDSEARKLALAILRGGGSGMNFDLEHDCYYSLGQPCKTCDALDAKADDPRCRT